MRVSPLLDCVVLTNPLEDENSRQKSSTHWTQGVGPSFPLPNSNSTWFPPPVSNYSTSQLQNNNEALLLESFNSEHSLLSNLQARDRLVFDAYSGLHPTESRSGASSGSTASPSIGSSVPNFGSGGSDTAQGSFSAGELKLGTADWVQSVEAEAGGGYLQNLSPLRVSNAFNSPYVGPLSTNE